MCFDWVSPQDPSHTSSPDQQQIHQYHSVLSHPPSVLHLPQMLQVLLHNTDAVKTVGQCLFGAACSQLQQGQVVHAGR